MKIKKFFGFLYECEFDILVLLLFMFALGMTYGCFSITMSDTAFEISDKGVLPLSLIEDNLLFLFLKNFLFILIVYFLGFSVIGIPFILASIAYYGLLCGTYLSYAINIFSYNKFIAFAFLIYLFLLLNLSSMICMSFSSIRLSLALFSVFKNDSRYVSPKFYLTPHTFKLALFAITVLISSLLHNFVAEKLLILL